jgi:hypothetical protein
MLKFTKTNLIVSIIFLSFTSQIFSFRKPEIWPFKSRLEIVKDQKAVYEMILADYAEILAAYEQVKGTIPENYNYAVSQLIYVISKKIQNGELHQYGNVFNHLVNSFIFAVDIPSYANIKYFETIYLPDAIGHLKKHCRDKKTNLDNTVDLLIQKLEDLLCIVRLSEAYQNENNLFQQNRLAKKMDEMNNKIKNNHN